MMRRLAVISTGLATMLMSSCSDLGGTSEQGNARVAGVIRLPGGETVPSAVVSLIPSEYDPVADGVSSCVVTTVSGAAGDFTFDKIRPGLYTLSAHDPRSGFRISIIPVSVTEHGDLRVEGTLRAAGSIRIISSVNIDTVNGYFYIQGTTAAGFARAGSGTTIDSVGAGVVPSIRYAVRGHPEKLRTVATNVLINPGAVTDVSDYQSWTHSAKLALNTASNGAGIAGTVTGFPLLVRLTAGNFPFEEAMAHGEDLRFSKPDKTPLPFEIERWDSLAGVAEVWVKIDTVRGNSTSQTFMMYWGNRSATAESAGASVFDTAAGYIGVWHCAEGGDVDRKDATANRFDGTTVGYDGDESTNGRIGPGDSLDMSNDAINVGPLLPSETLTLSLWIKAASFTPWGHLIAKASAPADSHPWLDWGLQLDSCPMPHVSMTVTTDRGDSSIETASTVPLDEWIYVTGTYDGSRATVYYNGKPEATFPLGGRVFTNGNDVCLGTLKTSPEQRFNGVIDEVRIAGRSHSADWIRLEYENQRANSPVVVFLK
jgi:hypothetical protein